MTKREHGETGAPGNHRVTIRPRKEAGKKVHNGVTGPANGASAPAETVAGDKVPDGATVVSATERREVDRRETPRRETG